MTNSSEQERYFLPLEDFYFDRGYLNDFIDNKIDTEDWYLFDCGGLRWTVRENYQSDRSECTAFERTPFFQELYNLFNVKINYGDIFFTRTPPPGIPPHVDRNRPVAINFPVRGSLVNSPMVWYDTFERTSLACSYNHQLQSAKTGDLLPVAFDPSIIHGVINEDDVDRCLLSIWWRNISFAEFKDLWKSGELINWDVNRENKYVKVLR